jgi:hypothetical protein
VIGRLHCLRDGWDDAVVVHANGGLAVVQIHVRLRWFCGNVRWSFGW